MLVDDVFNTLPLDLKQVELEIYLEVDFNQTVSTHLLHLVHANHCCKSGTYRDIYNVAISEVILL